MIKLLQLPNPSIGIEHLTPQQLAPIQQEIDAIQLDWARNPSYNSRLAGQIEHEYALVDSMQALADIIMPLAHDYYNQHRPQAEQLVLSEAWVNFQQAGEFNPPHSHSGLVSWVLWLKLPTDTPGPGQRSRNNVVGNFAFHYVNILGVMQHYHMPSTAREQGTLLLWPSGLNHSVNPFYTSEELRITISGNINIKG